VVTGPPTYNAPTYTPEVQSNRDRESTLGRRAEKASRAIKGRSPLGRAHYADSTTQYKDVRKAQRATEENIRREAARTTAVTERRAKSPVLSPDLRAMLLASNAARKVYGLPPHTLETFLHDMHRHALYPKTTYQNEAPQDAKEQDLLPLLGRSQGAPSEGLSQESRQLWKIRPLPSLPCHLPP